MYSASYIMLITICHELHVVGLGGDRLGKQRYNVAYTIMYHVSYVILVITMS